MKTADRRTIIEEMTGGKGVTDFPILEEVAEFLGLNYKLKIRDGKNWELMQQRYWYETNCSKEAEIYGDPNFLLAASSYTKCQTLPGAEKGPACFWTQGIDLSLDTIVDHGCGLGYSALRLAELCPTARVIGTNWPGPQLEFNEWLLKKYPHDNVEFLDERELEGLSGKLGRVFVLALDLFEHLRHPLEELDTIIQQFDPVALVEESPFTMAQTGHYPGYWFGDVFVSSCFSLHPRKQNKEWHPTLRFGAEIEKRGFKKQRFLYPGALPTRPRVWLRDNES